ncbi:MAG: flagellar hook-associated protein FlgK [Thermodesulfobacteriota bacterium]|nr:flagellar hook-associated protein FlgK [Thermodesulfobacteriota bacterium]
MSGSGLLLSIAKDALSAQQYGINVTAQNIANIDTPGYTKQTPVFKAKTPASYGGVIIGRGVTIDEIIQHRDSYLEDRLRGQKSILSGLKEEEACLSFLEGIFNENSDHSLGAQFIDFWNVWHDLSNNPSGELERTMVYETGSLLADNFQGLDESLLRVERDINLSIEGGIDQINRLTSKLALFNQEILNLEATGSANDLKDQRNMVLGELSGYIDVKCYQDDNGNFTVLTNGGYTLVDKNNTFLLYVEGKDVMWDGSGDSKVAITDSIRGGKIGSWLDMRDEIIAKYRADLSELAKSLILEVNKIHAQGAGKDAFTEVQGKYKIDDSSVSIDNSGLYFQDAISDGSFKLWVYDSNGDVVNLGGAGGELVINIDADVTTIDSIVSAIDGLDGGNISAEVTSEGYLKINASNGDTFAFSNDTTSALAVLGINTFFSGTNAGNIDLNSTLFYNKGLIAAGRVDSEGNIAAGDNSNAFAIANLQFEGVSVKSWSYERGEDSAYSDTTTTLENYSHSLVGLVGIHSKSVQGQRESHEIIVNQLTAIRDSVSSVSIDEEMTNLIKYQHAYAAAAKLITTADEMLKTLLAVK